MGAGHGYSYENFILIEENEINNKNYNDNFLDELDGLPLNKQIDLIVNENYNGLDSKEEVLERYKDDIISISSKENKDYESLDIDALKNENWEQDVDNSLYDDFREYLFEIGKSINSDFWKEENYNYYEEIKDFGSLSISSPSMLNPAELKLAMIADRYNSGIVSYIEDAKGNAYFEDIDFEEIFLNGYYYDDAGEYLVNIANDEEYLNNYEILIDFIDECENSLPEDEKKVLFENGYDSYKRVVELLDYPNDVTPDKLKERCQNDTEFAKELNEHKKTIYTNIHNLIDQETASLQKQYQDFTDEFMNRTILSYQDGTFYYPTSAWTSANYERNGVLFGNNVELQNKIKKEFGIAVDAMETDDKQLNKEFDNMVKDLKAKQQKSDLVQK